LVHALGDGYGKLSSMHGASSLLLTAPQPGIRALDREADPVEAGRLGVIPRQPTRAADCTGSVVEESRPDTRLGAAVSLGSVAGPARARRRYGSAAGNRELMTQNAPAFTQ
jgi:hypothetical protein